MPYISRKKRAYYLWERGRHVVLIAVGVLIVAGFWWWLATLGPKGTTTVAGTGSHHSASQREMEALRKEVDALVEKAMAVRPGGDVDLLAEAVERQNVLISKTGDGGVVATRRLQELERLAAEARSRPLMERIEQAEEMAARELEAERPDVAASWWRDALEWQRAINRSTAGSSMKNFVRESRLEIALLELQAAPLALEVNTALTTAREAADREDWPAALAAYTAAREGQATLNGEYAKTRFSNTMQLDRIEREIDSLDASALALEVDAHDSAGEEAMTQDRFEVAADAFAKARELQLRINQEFARSRFLSSPRVEALEVKRQTAASLPRIRVLREMEQMIARHLGRREVVAAAKLIVSAQERIEALYAQLPKSERLAPRLRLKLAYLSSQTERLGEIQDVVLARLRPLPGASELQMLQTEVPQSLYLQIMKTNPSRHPGRAFPVDSVSWMDAVQFCERLGWIMGQTVRLPTADEFRVVVGDATAQELPGRDAGSRESQSSEMASGPANAAGFFDLLGNVAEWLDAPLGERSGEPARVAGGSYMDEPASLRKLSLEERPRSDRARHIGFRFVLDGSGQLGSRP